MKKILLFVCSLTLSVSAQNNYAEKSTASPCACLVPLDSTFSVVAQCDDCSSNIISLPFNFNFYGTNYDSLYINNNGNISFSVPLWYQAVSGFPYPFAVIAPFWSDVETMATGSGHVYYKVTSTAIIVRWDSVGYFNNHIDKLNTFQIILTNGNDSILPPGNNIAFCYGEMEWTTGDASNGVSGFSGNPATAGLNKGNAINYILIGQFDTSGTTFFSPTATNNQVGWLTNKSFSFNVSSSTNVPPIIVINHNCDTINICTGDTTLVNAFVLSPESAQTAAVTVNLNGLTGATVLPFFSGNTVNAQVQIISSPANLGCWTISFTAIDNGNPSDTTINNVIICSQNCATVGLSEIKNQQSTITISPNPFTSTTTITFNEPHTSTNSATRHTLKIMDVIGKEIKTITFTGKQCVIEKGEMKAGVYFVEVKTEGKIINKKILVQ